MKNFKAKLYSLGLEYFKLLLPYDAINAPYGSPLSKWYRFLLLYYVKLLESVEVQQNKVLECIQRNRFHNQCREARRLVWWQKNFFARGMMPVHRTELMDVPLELLTRKPNLQQSFRVVWRKTSGTSGIPFVWGIDKKVLYLEGIAYILRAVEHYGISIKEFIGKEHYFILLNSGSFITRPLSLVLTWRPNAVEQQAQFNSAVGKIKKAGRGIMYTFPSDLLLFTQELERNSIQLPIDLILTTGQVLDEAVRRYVSQYFGCPVFSLYVTKEELHIGWECLSRLGTFHINQERILVEILDEHSYPLPPEAVGDIVVSALDYRWMPLLRYQTGDRGKLLLEQCACGVASPRIEFQGRDLDFIYLADGRLFSYQHITPLLLEDIFFSRIRQFQIRQETLHRIQISIMPRGTFEQHFLNLLYEKLRLVVPKELMIEINVTPNIPLPAGKYQRFVPLKSPFPSNEL